MNDAALDISSRPIQDLAQHFLIRIRDICSQFQIVSLNRQVEACESLLRKNQTIDVAILGQLKAGKSSFINRLIGKSILPVGVIPVTTVITLLQYGKKERAVIHRFDGEQMEVDIASIENFTSEAKNPGNEKNVYRR